jgi:hypothetical protein
MVGRAIVADVGLREEFLQQAARGDEAIRFRETNQHAMLDGMTGARDAGALVGFPRDEAAHAETELAGKAIRLGFDQAGDAEGLAGNDKRFSRTDLESLEYIFGYQD